MGARVAVAGASGYTGGELLRLLAGHPDLEIGPVTGQGNVAGSIRDQNTYLLDGGQNSDDMAGTNNTYRVQWSPNPSGAFKCPRSSRRSSLFKLFDDCDSRGVGKRQGPKSRFSAKRATPERGSKPGRNSLLIILAKEAINHFSTRWLKSRFDHVRQRLFRNFSRFAGWVPRIMFGLWVPSTRDAESRM